MALDAPQIHGMRQVFRDLTDDEDLLSKETLRDSITSDAATQDAVRHVSGFVFHALRAGSFEVSLQRMKTRKPGFLTMDEFLAFVNTAATRMAKGESPNMAGLYDDRIPGVVPRGLVEDGGGPGVDVAAPDESHMTPEELAKQQREVDHRAHRKMLSSIELGKLLRPKSGGRGPSRKKPDYLAKPSPFTIEASVVTPRTSQRMSGSLRPRSSASSRSSVGPSNPRRSQKRLGNAGQRPQTSSGVRPLSATPFGAGGHNTGRDGGNSYSGSILVGGEGGGGGGRGGARARGNRRPRTAGASGHGYRRCGPAGGSMLSMEGSMLSGQGSAVEDFEWQRQPEFITNPSVQQRLPPNALLASRVIDQERKIREMSLTVLKLTKQHRVDERDLAAARTNIARLQGTLRSVRTNSSSRSRPGTAPVRRRQQQRNASRTEGHQGDNEEEKHELSDGNNGKNQDDDSSYYDNGKHDQALLTNGEEPLLHRLPEDLQCAVEDVEELKMFASSRIGGSGGGVGSKTRSRSSSPELEIQLRGMEEKIKMLQVRNDALLSVVGVVRGQKGRKYNRPSLRPPSSRGRKQLLQFERDKDSRGGQNSPDEILQALHREVAYSTSLEEEVERRGERMRRLEHKGRILEKRELHLRTGAMSRTERMRKLQILIESLKARDHANSKLIMDYRSKIKSDLSVEQKILRVCRAICLHYDKREGRGADTEQVGVDAGALKAGVSALSKHVLEQDAKIRRREQDIENHKREERRLNERIDALSGVIKKHEFAVEMAQAHAAALKDQYETNAARGFLDAGSSVLSNGSAIAFDANDSIILGTPESQKWEATAKELFRMLDTDKDGFLSRVEFTRAATLNDEGNSISRRVAELQFHDESLRASIQALFDSEQTSHRIFSACQHEDGSGRVNRSTLRSGFESFDIDVHTFGFGNFASLFDPLKTGTIDFQTFDAVFWEIKSKSQAKEFREGMREALDALPALRHQLMPKAYLHTVSDMFPNGVKKISLDEYMLYMSLLRRFMNVPGAKLGTFRMPHDGEKSHGRVSAENSVQLSVSSVDSQKDPNIWITEQREARERKIKEDREAQEKKQAEEQAREKAKDSKRRADEQNKIKELEGPYKLHRRALPKRKQLDMFEHLLVKEMGDNVSRVIRATVRLRHVLASATAIARSSQRHFNETVVRVMNECAQAMNCERAALFVVDHEKGELEAYIGSSQKIYLDMNDGIAGAAARSNETIIVNDCSKDDRFSSRSDRLSGFKTRNLMACPGHDEHQKCIVVLEVLNRFGPGKYSMLDEILLEIMSDISACFVSHARKNRDLDRALEQRRLVMTTVPSLWGGFLEMDKVRFLQSIEDVVRNAVGAIVVCIYIRDMAFFKESEKDKEVKRQRDERRRNIRRELRKQHKQDKSTGKKMPTSSRSENAKARVMASLDVHRKILRSSRSHKVMTKEHHRVSVVKKVNFIEVPFDQPGQGAVAQAMRSGVPIYCEDAYNEMVYNPLVDMDIQGLATVIQPVVNKEGIVIACIQGVFPTLRNRNKELLSEISEQLPPLFAAASVIDTLNGKSVAEQSFVMRKATVRIQSLFRQRRGRKDYQKKKSAAQQMQAVSRGWKTRKKRRMSSAHSLRQGKVSAQLLNAFEDAEPAEVLPEVKP